jgi:uncharacterized protein (DUF305 family)
MQLNRAGAAGALLSAALLAVGCASASGPDGRVDGPPGAVPERAPGGDAAVMRADSLARLEALFRARIREDRLRFTEADVRFMTDMIAHHGQALEMSRLAPTRGAAPTVQGLAARILAGQQDEIVIMQQWLRDRGQPVPGVGTGAHHGHRGHDDVAMPGMLTPAQMAALERARGPEFDRLFLMLMIEHHRGAVVMVDQLMASDGAAQDPVVFRLAADIHAEQTAEIGRMQRMLMALIRGSQ